MYRDTEQASGRKDTPLGDFPYASALVPSNPEKLFVRISATKTWIIRQWTTGSLYHIQRVMERYCYWSLPELISRVFNTCVFLIPCPSVIQLL